MRTKIVKLPNRGGEVAVIPDHERAIRIMRKHDGMADAAKLVRTKGIHTRPLDLPASQFIKVWTQEEVRRNHREVPNRVFYWMRENPQIEKVAYSDGRTLKFMIEKLDAGVYK